MLSYRTPVSSAPTNRRCFQPLTYFLMYALSAPCRYSLWVYSALFPPTCSSGRTGRIISSTILLRRNPLHYSLQRYVTSSLEVITILDTTVGASQLFTQPHSRRPSRNTDPHRSLRPPWYQQSVSYGSSGMVHQSRADQSIYNRLVRAFTITSGSAIVWNPLGQAVHRSAFRLACKRLCPALLTRSDTFFLGWRDTTVAVFLRLPWCTDRIVSSFPRVLDALFSNGKFCLLDYVFSPFFRLLTRLRRPISSVFSSRTSQFAQTLVYLAQNNIYVSTVACHFGAKMSIFSTWQNRFTSLNADFLTLRGMQNASPGR